MVAKRTATKERMLAELVGAGEGKIKKRLDFFFEGKGTWLKGKSRLFTYRVDNFDI